MKASSEIQADLYATKVTQSARPQMPPTSASAHATVGLGASGLATKGVDAASEAALAAQKQLTRYADVTGRYVSQQPVKSVLIAVAAGAAIAALVVAARRRSRY